MSLLRRPRKPRPSGLTPELRDLARQGDEHIALLAQAHQGWGAGSADRWDLDQTTGVISWTFPHQRATAKAQILGSYSPNGGTWMWAWANESILPDLRHDAETLRAWGEAHGHPAFTEPVFTGDAGTVGDLVAAAVLVLRATGFYRGPGAGGSYVAITFGDVTLTPTPAPDDPTAR